MRTIFYCCAVGSLFLFLASSSWAQSGGSGSGAAPAAGNTSPPGGNALNPSINPSAGTGTNTSGNLGNQAGALGTTQPGALEPSAMGGGTSYQNPPAGNANIGVQTGPAGANINTPRGNVGVNAGPGGVGIDVNRNGTSGPTEGGALGNGALNSNAQQRQDIREDRQNLRQDLRNDRVENRLDRRAENVNDPNRWRFVWNNGEWWYWLPNNSWVYWRDNRWAPYDTYSYRPFGYQTGYRGIDTGTSFYYDENGRRYRRDYAPERPRGGNEAELNNGAGSQFTGSESSESQRGIPQGGQGSGMQSGAAGTQMQDYRSTGSGPTSLNGKGVVPNADANGGSEIGGANGSKR